MCNNADSHDHPARPATLVDTVVGILILAPVALLICLWAISDVRDVNRAITHAKNAVTAWASE